MAEEDDFVRITLRIPAALHARLNDAAAKKRSMNAEIIARLEDSFSDLDRENKSLSQVVAEKTSELLSQTLADVIEGLIRDKADPVYILQLINAVEGRYKEIRAERKEAPIPSDTRARKVSR